MTYYPTDDTMTKICPWCAEEHNVPKFFAALQYEAQYPVRWGGAILDPSDYVNLLPVDYSDKLHAREEEYTTPRKERLYCQNLVYVAPKTDESSQRTALHKTGIIKAEDEPKEICNAFNGRRHIARTESKSHHCFGWMCGRSGARWEGIPTEDKSCCSDDTDDEHDRIAGINFEGLVRGKDYQMCPHPSCGLPVFLGEACNHMTCPSIACGGTQFCFICGKPATHDSRHWTAGMPCPRFNRPGAGNALYDGDLVDGHMVRPAEGLADALPGPVAPPPATDRNAPNEQALEREHAWRAFRGDLLELEDPAMWTRLSDLSNEHEVAHITAMREGRQLLVHDVALELLLCLHAIGSRIMTDILASADEGRLTRYIEQVQGGLDNLACSLEQIPVGGEEFPALQAGVEMLRERYMDVIERARAALAGIREFGDGV